MRESVNAIVNFEVDSAVDVDVVKESVFVDEFLGGVGQHDADILWSVEWSLEVEVLDVKGDKLFVLLGEDAVENELDEVEGCGLDANAAGLCDVLADNGDASAVEDGLLRPDVANNL